MKLFHKSDSLFHCVNSRYYRSTKLKTDEQHKSHNKNNAYFGDIEDDKDRNVSKSISIISSSKDLSEINKMFFLVWFIFLSMRLIIHRIS